MTSVRGTPARATPVAGSVRISERNSFSSTQYGPSVTVGVEGTASISGLDCLVPGRDKECGRASFGKKGQRSSPGCGEFKAGIQLIFPFAAMSIFDTAILL